MKKYRNGLNPERILAIGAHPDDIELGCGGTLAKYAKDGVEILALVLTKGEVNGNGRNRIAESKRALTLLGINNIEFCKLEDTMIYKDLRKTILIIERFCQEFAPHRIYTMVKDDSHQDHWATHMATMVACRGVSQLLCYETFSTLPTFTPNIFENISLWLNLKKKALAEHISQKTGPYMKWEAIVCRAKFWGLQAGVSVAEAFQAHKLVL